MLDILYEDDSILCVNKSAGTLVIPTIKNEKNTLTMELCQYLADKNQTVKAHPCHRLDRDTSGVIIYAKGKKNQQAVMNFFHSKLIKKTYLAVANGKIKNDSGSIRKKIDSKSAVTNYQVVKKTEKYTVVDIDLLTGRTNQVRIHFQSIGHPLLGDFKFGIRKEFKIKMKRTALHAYSISFPHPANHQLMTLTAPVPPDLHKFLE